MGDAIATARLTRTYMAKTGELPRRWLVVDATDKPLGRLSVKIATVLQGKHRPTWTPHIDTGDFVIVTNVEKIKVTGDKRNTKLLHKWTGYPGGLRYVPLGELLDRKPQEVLRLAVRRMLPKGRLGKKMFGKLKIYRGTKHPHGAQQPQPAGF